MSPEKPRRLGRGLEALIPIATAAIQAPTSDLQRIPIGSIRPNPFQPRRQFDPSELAELEASLKRSGLLQPITVRRKENEFQLIAGERRLRAATSLGWSEIAAIVRDFDDETMLVLALVENLQRANLNPIEEARGYRKLIDEFRLTQQQVGEAVGKDRTTVTNLLRVLSLPDEVQQKVESGALTLGHARALLALGESPAVLQMADHAITEKLSVRELEQRVRTFLSPDQKVDTGRKKNSRSTASQETNVDSATRRVEDDLRRYLQTDVRLNVTGTAKGRVEISFYSTDDLERILELILREARRDY